MAKFAMSKWDDFGKYLKAATSCGTSLEIAIGSRCYWHATNIDRRVSEVSGTAASVEQAKRLCAAAARYIENSPKARGW